MGCKETIVFACTYPRLDVNVSTHRNHLLKSPFVAHPKTGRVCVPIDPNECDSFDPFKVPTLLSLSEEINNYDAKNPDKANSTRHLDKTSMKNYMNTFEKTFMEPLRREIRE